VQPLVVTSSPWYLLHSGPGDYAFNMALDEALLQAAPRLSQPVLRFYSWTEAAASFGYFQKYAEIERMTLLRPLVRRPTGGGLVPHDADWTYSLVFPPGHEWHGLRAEESYRRIHEWIQRALARLNVPTELAPTRHLSPVTRHFATGCFVGHEKHDLLWRGRKIAGAAQRRNKLGLLIQGSIQPPSKLTGRADWEMAMRQAGQEAFGAVWSDFEPDAALRARAEALAGQKYSRREFNARR
jgi:lipoate-protein ligase A